MLVDGTMRVELLHIMQVSCTREAITKQIEPRGSCAKSTSMIYGGASTRLIHYSYPAISIFSGNADSSNLEAHAAFQFFGVN